MTSKCVSRARGRQQVTRFNPEVARKTNTFLYVIDIPHDHAVYLQFVKVHLQLPVDPDQTVLTRRQVLTSDIKIKIIIKTFYKITILLKEPNLLNVCVCHGSKLQIPILSARYCKMKISVLRLTLPKRFPQSLHFSCYIIGF